MAASNGQEETEKRHCTTTAPAQHCTAQYSTTPATSHTATNNKQAHNQAHKLAPPFGLWETASTGVIYCQTLAGWASQRAEIRSQTRCSTVEYRHYSIACMMY